jgi:hypothetical protein
MQLYLVNTPNNEDGILIPEHGVIIATLMHRELVDNMAQEERAALEDFLTNIQIQIKTDLNKLAETYRKQLKKVVPIQQLVFAGSLELMQDRAIDVVDELLHRMQEKANKE